MKKLSLPEVTLVSVSSVDLDNTQLALLISSQRIDFGAVKLLSSGLPSHLVNGIEYVGVPPMTLVGYNRFVLGQLHQYVDTPHCLIVQADGFVLDSTRWTPEFLEYDYTGAPWPARVPVYPAGGHAEAIGFLDLARNRVGNGGFSLRSRKLLQATGRIEYDRLSFPVMSEDIVVCHFLYDEMRAQGIRFAPFEVAARFSFESPSGHAERSVFGFHGKWMRDILLDDATFRADVAAVKAASERSAGATAEAGRNDPCPCGSGRRYKHCHGVLG